MDFVRTCGVEISAPAAKVYALVADLTQHPRWVYNKLTMQHLSGEGVGAKYRSEVREIMPGSKKPIRSDITVIEDAPLHRFVFEAEDSSGRYRWTYEFTETAGKTQVNQTCVRLKAPFPIPWIQPLMWSALGRKQVQGGLEKLKALAETEALLPRQDRVVELPAEERQT